MSWWIHLEDDRGHEEGCWNYTSNVARMVYGALEAEGYELPLEYGVRGSRRGPDGEWAPFVEDRPMPWWKHLDGMSGPDGARFLGTIIRGLEVTPEKYRAMNPANGWGDYDSWLELLHEMHRSVPEWPTTWSASG